MTSPELDDEKYAQTAPLNEKRGSDRPRSRSRSPRDDRRKHFERSRESKGVSALIKLLVPDKCGGAIIGKKGSNLNEMEELSGGGRLKISTSGNFYPGSDHERILLLTGTIQQITELNLLVMKKVTAECTTERAQTVKIVIPNTTAGIVIGKSGADIKALKEETKAKIVINSNDSSAVKGERLITISGDTEAIEAACREVIAIVAGDEQNLRSNSSLLYEDRDTGRDRNDRESGYGGGIPNDILSGSTNLESILGQPSQFQAMLTQQNQLAALGGLQNATAPIGNAGFGGLNLAKLGGDIIRSIKTTATINIEVPDHIAMKLVGSGDHVLREFMQFSGAEIELSSRNDYTSSGTGRMLTIFGNLSQVQIAYHLVKQKI